MFTVYKSYIVVAGAGDLLPTAIEHFGGILVLMMVQANADGYIFVEKGKEIVEEGEEIDYKYGKICG